jgi:hypothetical protein
MKTRTVPVLFLFILALCLAAGATDAPFTVKEYLNIARTNAPVFTGVAFNLGEVTDLGQLSLFSGTTEIPAQFDKLVRTESGQVQWALCSFVDNLGARAEKSYVVKQQAPSVTPSTVITVTRNGSVVTIDNGVLSFALDTVNFCGLQSVKLGGTDVISGTSGGYYVYDEVESQGYTNGTVTQAQFIYLGPLRATYRVEGESYRGASCGGLGFSYMVTAYAGCPRLQVEITMRNSINATCGRMAKIRRAYAAFPLAYSPTAVGTMTDIKGYEGNGVGVAILDKWAGGYYPGNLHNLVVNGNTVEVDIIRQGGTGDGYADGTYKFMDMDHKNTEIWLEFYSGTKTATQIAQLSLVIKSKLVGRPDPAYLSSTRALSGGRFGTLEDEKACYNMWGWTYSGWRTKGFNRPDTNPRPNAAVPWEDIHYEAETDDAEGMLLQWIRTGYRGHWDIGEAWARYYKTHYPFHSIDFEHDGTGTVWDNQYWCRATEFCNRQVQTVGGEPGYWDRGWHVGKVDVQSWTACHFFGAGLLDYYCLTGDIDALEGAIELAEVAWLPDNPVYDDTLDSYDYGGRATGRMLMHLTRLYEVLRDSTSFFRANFRAKMVLRSKRTDPRGFLYSSPALWGNWDETMTAQTNWPDSLKQYVAANGITLDYSDYDSVWVVKGTDRWPIHGLGGSWQQTYVQMGIERWYRTTGDENARDYIIGYAQNAALHVTYKCGIVPYNAYFDFPEKGMLFQAGDFTNWDPAHNVCVGSHSTTSGSLPSHSGWYTVYFPGVCALGYRFTGFKYLLEKGKDIWDRGSKREYQSTYFFAGANEVGYFAYHNPPKDDGLMNSNHMFYEYINHGDTVPPQAVTDLSVSRNATQTGLVFRWTAPADNNGVPKEYQIKYFKDRTIVDYLNYDYPTRDSVEVPWWYTHNVSGEPAPSSAGTPEGYELTGSFPTNEVFYAAVRTRDASNNLSPMSNVVTIDNTIKVEGSGELYGPLALTAQPNPGNPAIKFKIFVLGKSTGHPVLTIYDLTGKKIRRLDLKAALTGKKAAAVVWQGTDDRGKNVSSGVYLAVLTADNLQLKKKIVLAK